MKYLYVVSRMCLAFWNKNQTQCPNFARFDSLISSQEKSHSYIGCRSPSVAFAWCSWSSI